MNGFLKLKSETLPHSGWVHRQQTQQNPSAESHRIQLLAEGGRVVRGGRARPRLISLAIFIGQV